MRRIGAGEQGGHQGSRNRAAHLIQLLAVEPVVSVIAGATKPEQVRANAAAGAWEPTRAELNELLAL